MPQLVVSALVAAGYTAAVAQIIVFVATIAVSAIVQGQASRRAKRAALESKLSGLKDNQITVRSGTEARKTVYGRCRVGGLLPFLQTSGEDKRYMYVVIVMAAHEIDAVEKVFFNEYEVTPDADGFVTGDQFKAKKPNQNTYEGTASGVTFTLPAVPYRIISVSQGVVDTSADAINYLPIQGWTENGATITLPAGYEGATIAVNYETATLTPKAKIQFFLGSPNQAADADLVAACPNEWTSNHRLRGCAYARVVFEFDSDVYQGGVPQVSFVIRGKKLFDPRTGLTAWSRNPALIAADWRASKLGMDLPAINVDEQWLVAAANRCDEPVEFAPGETHARYECDCVLEAIREASSDALDNIIETMAGGKCDSSGLWRVWAGGFRVPEVRLTGADLAGGVSWSSVPPAEDLFNTVKGTFLDEERGFQEASFAQVSEKQLVVTDGAVISAEEKWAYTTNKHRALRLSKIRIRAARGGTLQGTFKLSAWRLLPGEMVYVAIPYLKLVDRLMMVESMELDGEAGTVKLQLRELLSSVWTWDYRELEVLDREVEAQFPNVSEVLGPQNVVVQSGPDFAIVAADGSVTNRLRVVWSEPLDGLATSTEIEWKTAGASAFRDRVEILAGSTSSFLGPVTSGQQYIVRLRHKNIAGQSSLWEVLSHVASDAQGAPASVLQLQSDSGSNIAPGTSMKIRWQKALFADRYIIEVRADGQIRRTRTIYATEYQYTWEDAKADGGPWRTIAIDVQAANASASSASKATITLQNLAPAQPTVQIIEGIESLVVRTGRPGDTDFQGMIVWGSSAAGFSPGPANILYDGPDVNFVLANVSAQMYFRVAHYDTFGKSDSGAGLNVSVQASGTPSPAGGIRVYPASAPPNILDPDHPEVWYNTTLETLFMEVNGQYIDVRDGGSIYAASIAANKISVVNLGAISASLGTVTSGRFEVDAAGYIRGGQTAFANGTGFYLGYSAGKYVFSLGQSGGAGLVWNGTQLEIRNSLGQLILSTDSGVFIPDLSVTLAKIDTASIGSLSALSANFGTMIAGFLSNQGGRNYINLNAAGNQPFIAARDAGFNVKASINADGSTRFVNLLGSGVWVGSEPMTNTAPGGFDPGGND
jgi:hypothetical protein